MNKIVDKGKVDDAFRVVAEELTLKNYQMALVVHKCTALPIYESEHYCKGYVRESGSRCAFRGTENNIHDCHNPKNLGGMIKI